MNRRVFLRTMDVASAWELVRSRARVPDPLPHEDVATQDALGRVNARAVYAATSSPSYHAAAMDGWAVRAAATLGASEATPVRLTKEKDTVPVDTGDPMPDDFDAVVMVEHVHEPDPGTIEIVQTARPWQHVRLTGEDLVLGELVTPQGKRLGPYDIATLLAAGVTQLAVRRRPRVALIATGDELVEPGATAHRGAVVEFNTSMLRALASEWGAEALRLPPVADNAAALAARLSEALARADIVVLVAGSSAGRDDITPQAIAGCGELLVHGINIMPGKPTAAGITPDGRPVLGLPGYPVSCAVAAERLLRPLVAHYLGIAPPERDRIRARVGRKVPSKVGHEEVVRVSVGRVAGGWVAAPLPRGAGIITSLSRANGLMSIPSLCEGLDAGEEIDVELLVARTEAELTLVHVGSHDLALDLAGDLLRRRHPGRSLASANVGSLAGLHALSRGECHFAGTHLLDPETGDYNEPYVRRTCAGRKVVLVTLCTREQGLTVLPGNPKAIREVADLARGAVSIVNRQRGAGTRVLLDARLAQAGIAPDAVSGYNREEHTHMAAAVAVASGIADCALTIRAAAQALGLGFVPLERERYDLALFASDLAEPHIAALLDTIRSVEFRQAAERLGGYDTSMAGDIVAEVG